MRQDQRVYIFMIPETGTREEFKHWILDNLWVLGHDAEYEELGHLPIVLDFGWVMENMKPLNPGETMLWDCMKCKHQWVVLREQLITERDHRMRFKKRF